MNIITKMTLVAVTGALILGAAAPQKAQADDKTWATVGKILTGFVVADKVFNHDDHSRDYDRGRDYNRGRGYEPSYSQTRVTYTYGVPVRCEPPPPRYCPPPPRWIPSHYETRCESVWTEGYYRTVTTPAVFDWVWDYRCNRRVWTEVRPACTTQVWVAGHYEQREVQIWVAGCYAQN